MRAFPPISPVESRTLTFDFTKDLPVNSILSGTPLISIVLISGPATSTSGLLVGSPQINGTKILQEITNVPSGCTFGIEVSCGNTIDSQIIAEGGIITGKVSYLQ